MKPQPRPPTKPRPPSPAPAPAPCARIATLFCAGRGSGPTSIVRGTACELAARLPTLRREARLEIDGVVVGRVWRLDPSERAESPRRQWGWFVDEEAVATPPPMLDDDLPSDAVVAIYEGAHVARVKYAPVSRAVRVGVVRVAARGGVL